MKKRIWSFMAILLTLFSLTSNNIHRYNAYADQDLIKINNSVIKVVLPTDVNFFIDPYEIMEKGTMIISPDFNIINKSSVPIKVDMSFKLSADNNIPLSIKNERYSVSSNSGDKEIWFAAVFSNDIEHKITSLKNIKVDKGIILLKEPIKIYTTNSNNTVVTEEQGIAVSGSAIGLIINDTSNSIAKDDNIKGMTEAVSGAAIGVIINDTSNGIVKDDEVKSSTEAVSGAAIDVIIEDTSNISNTSESKMLTESVSGSAISSIIYEDTERVFARFGDVSGLTENSPNVLVINEEFGRFTFFLDKAKAYYFSDGSIVTAELAEDNRGVFAFRFIGELNPNANWRNVNLKVTAVYSVEEVYDMDYSLTKEYTGNEDAVENSSNMNQDLQLDLVYTPNNELYYNKDDNNEGN